MLALVYLIHECYYHFWHFFAYAHMHIIMLSYHSSSLQTLTLSPPNSSTVCMSLTLTVVQYERSTVRHHRLLIPITPTVLANKYIYIHTQTTSTNEQ